MDLVIKGKSLDIGDALRSHVESNLANYVGKYFPKAHDGAVTISREKHLFRADIQVHPLKGMVVQGRASADDAYAAFDAALERIAKQLRRYKRRLNNHHKSLSEEPPLVAQQFIIAPESEEEELPTEGQPAIIAELSMSIDTLSVGEAVMRMDLSDATVLMFRNQSHGGLNVVYRRSDGNIGWIDPANTARS